MMDVKAIVKQWLIDNKYDGLWSDMGDCACPVDDLFPCNMEGVQDCEPGVKGPCSGTEHCPADGECDWHIVPKGKQ